MNRRIIITLAAAGSLALMVSGCANKEVIKSDQQLPATTTRTAENAAEQSKPQAKAISQAVVKSDAAVPGNTANTPSVTEQTPLEKVYFDFDSYVLTATARETLEANYRELANKSKAQIRIEGHCDERGSDEYNIALGEKRAKAAQQYLSTLGIPAGNISIISYGKEKPADPAHTEAAWAMNRRDEFVLANR